jgi:hypothetical protein
MAGLTAERLLTRKIGTGLIDAQRLFPVEAGTTLYQGGLVALNAAGNAIPASPSALLVCGRAITTVTNLGAAGAQSVVAEAGVLTYDNGTGVDAIGVANIGAVCFASDDHTVNLTSAGGTRPPAGIICNYYNGVVEVFIAPWIAGLILASPLVQRGTATLVAGSKTISAGVSLTAASVILLSRKTQGGTVTSTVVYEAPGASRVVGAPGTGAFTLQASVAAGTANAADTSTLDWEIVG